MIALMAVSTISLASAEDNISAKIYLKDSKDAGLGGAVVQYYSGGWKSFGTTDSTGLATKDIEPGTYNIKVTYAGYTKEYKNISFTIADCEEIFNTKEFTVEFKESGNDPISGGVVGYYAGGWKSFGTTDANGLVSKELLPGTYNFKMSYAGYTLEEKNVNTNTQSTLLFTTKKFTVEFKESGNAPISGGVVGYYAGGWKSFGTTGADGLVSKELLPGTYSFKMSYAGYTLEEKNVNINSQDLLLFQTKNYEVRFFDSSNAPISGGVVGYYAGGWKSFGTTGASGSVFKELLPGTYSFKMSYAGYTLEEKNVNINTSDFTIFQTVNVEVKLVNSDGAGLEGGTVNYYAGGWKSFGTTNASGQAFKELLPGTYSFKMYWKGLSQEIKNVKVPDNSPVVFGTTTVNVQYSGSVQYYAGGWKNYSQPMEMLPYNYDFKFDGVQTSINVSGDEVDLSAVLLKLKDGNNGVSGGTAKYYYKGWKSIPGSTDNNGNLLYLMDGQMGNLTFKMYYAGASMQKSQDISKDSVVVFEGEKVTVELTDSLGNPLAGANVKYYASGWKDFGTTGADGKVTKFLLPGNYTFKLYYEGYSQQKKQNVGQDPTVEFQTEKVTVQLLNSKGQPYTGVDANVKYYASGWKDFGTLDKTSAEVSKELLPGNYTFKMYYAGYAEQKKQAIVEDDVTDFVVFNTVNVIVQLNDSNGDPFTGIDANVKYYASGWKNFGTWDKGSAQASMELLPGTYTFKMYYEGFSKQVKQNIANNPIVNFADPNGVSADVTFSTGNTVVKLIDSEGHGIEGADVKYYASGWKDFGETDSNGEATKELLPGTYTFKIYYAGASMQKKQDIGANNTVLFQTESVTVKLLNSSGASLVNANANVKYYASGWKDFGTWDNVEAKATMELLPVKYTFKMYYAGASMQQSYTVTADNSPDFIEFGTVEVTVKLKNSSGDPLPGGYAKYYASGWKDFGEWDNDSEISIQLLPVKYTFKMYYAGASNQKSQDVSTDPIVVFNTINQQVKLQRCDESGVEGGVAKYYASGWKDFGTTDASGLIEKELLPGDYSVKMTLNGFTEQKNTNGSSELIFKTTTVTLNYAGNVQFYASGWKTFDQPTMDMLPGTYSFKFDGHSKQLDISGCGYEKTAFVVRLLDHTGKKGLEGGVAKVYDGSWITLGTTDKDGFIVTLEDGSIQGKKRFNMNYNTTAQDKYVTVENTPLISFQTVEVTVELLDHAGDTIADGYTTSFYGNDGHWHNAVAAQEMLPSGKYRFNMNYNYTAQDKYLTVPSTDTTLTFQTALIAIELWDNGTLIADGYTTSFYGNDGHWHNALAAQEMLPSGKYRFTLSYNGNDLQKYYTIPDATDGTVKFEV